MKALGALTIIGSCLGLSLTAIRSVKNRIRSMFWLCRAVEMIRAELSSRMSPLPELMRLAADRSEGECRAFFEKVGAFFDEPTDELFPERWEKSARSCLPSLRESERRELILLGQCIGRYEIHEQLASCDRFLASVSAAHDGELSRFSNNRRVFLALGTAAGAFLCLILL